MSIARVTREGPEGRRAGREAAMWSGPGKGHRGEFRSHPGTSYYGLPIINSPIWEERDIAGYLFTGGLAGASSLLGAIGDLAGLPVLAARAKYVAAGALGVSLVALVHDLGRPARFLNMLRVVKPTSPMNIGSWVLAAYGPLAGASAFAAASGIGTRLGRVAGVGAAGLGAAVSSYTAALIADTAVPVWHEGRRELPYLFVSSAAAAGGGAGLVLAPLAESGPAALLAVMGAVGELSAEQLLSRRLADLAWPLHEDKAGRRLRLAKALLAAGGLGAVLGRRSRIAAAASGAALLAGSAFTRFGIFAAGMASALDPDQTVAPQRARLEAGSADWEPTVSRPASPERPG